MEPGELERRQSQLGLVFSGETITPEWYGEGCDYGEAINALFAARPRGDPDLN